MAIRSLGESSVSDAAVATGRSHEAVHFHVRELLKAGLIQIKGRRPTSRRPEAVYTPAAAAYRLPDAETDPSIAAISRRAVAAGIRQSLRGYLAAAEAAAKHPEETNYVQVIRAAIRLRPDDAETFYSLLKKASDFARAHEAADGERLHWSSLVYPDLKR